MESDYRVRIGQPQDLESLVRLQDQYRVFYKQQSNPAANLQYLLKLQPQDSVVFVAQQKTTSILIGFARLFPVDSLTSLTTNWILNDLYVDEAHRKRGIGRSLLKACEEFGNENKVKWLMLDTAKTNFTAQGLYEGCGWKRSGIEVYEFQK